MVYYTDKTILKKEGGGHLTWSSLQSSARLQVAGKAEMQKGEQEANKQRRWPNPSSQKNPWASSDQRYAVSLRVILS